MRMIRISWEDRDHNVWLALEGELDHTDCLEIRDEFHERIQKGDGDVIVVMDGLKFMSSMGIGMLVKASETLRKQATGTSSQTTCGWNLRTIK